MPCLVRRFTINIIKISFSMYFLKTFPQSMLKSSKNISMLNQLEEKGNINKRLF